MESNNYLSKVLYSYEEIINRIKELAKQINNYYKNIKEEIVIMPILDGASIFCSHLLLELDFMLTVNSIKISSYEKNLTSNNEPKFSFDIPIENLENKYVLIVEDLVDTGNTFYALEKYLESKKPKNVKTCVLFQKKVSNAIDIKLDFKGFDIQDQWVAGFGIDSQGLFRNIKDFGIVNQLYIKNK